MKQNKVENANLVYTSKRKKNRNCLSRREVKRLKIEQSSKEGELELDKKTQKKEKKVETTPKDKSLGEDSKIISSNDHKNEKPVHKRKQNSKRNKYKDIYKIQLEKKKGLLGKLSNGVNCSTVEASIHENNHEPSLPSKKKKKKHKNKSDIETQDNKSNDDTVSENIELIEEIKPKKKKKSKHSEIVNEICEDDTNQEISESILPSPSSKKKKKSKKDEESVQEVLESELSTSLVLKKKKKSKKVSEIDDDVKETPDLLKSEKTVQNVTEISPEVEECVQEISEKEAKSQDDLIQIQEIPENSEKVEDSIQDLSEQNTPTTLKKKKKQKIKNLSQNEDNVQEISIETEVPESEISLVETSKKKKKSKTDLIEAEENVQEIPESSSVSKKKSKSSDIKLIEDSEFEILCNDDDEKSNFSDGNFNDDLENILSELDFSQFEHKTKTKDNSISSKTGNTTEAEQSSSKKRKTNPEIKESEIVTKKMKNDDLTVKENSVSDDINNSINKKKKKKKKIKDSLPCKEMEKVEPESPSKPINKSLQQSPINNKFDQKKLAEILNKSSSKNIGVEGKPLSKAESLKNRMIEQMNSAQFR